MSNRLLQLRKNLIGSTFETPPKTGYIRKNWNICLKTAVDFDVKKLFVKYEIVLSKTSQFDSLEDAECPFGLTQIVQRSKKIDENGRKVNVFSLSFPINLVLIDNCEDSSPRASYIIFTIYSVDFFGNYREIGVCSFCLDRGVGVCDHILSCVQFLGTPRENLQNFFIGGLKLKDVSSVVYGNPESANIISMLGGQTLSAGSLMISANLVTQQFNKTQRMKKRLKLPPRISGFDRSKVDSSKPKTLVSKSKLGGPKIKKTVNKEKELRKKKIKGELSTTSKTLLIPANQDDLLETPSQKKKTKRKMGRTGKGKTGTPRRKKSVKSISPIETPNNRDSPDL
eukprot:TRINITY_DN2456_c0_g1_i1.p1 TRINITY_DN2456_c0_g1~~TRINITY_DN2456_c0_g1_i1.p1  ORF type:complete len:340 (+),score=97.40 TRINITY_DN2456_c0_g1_i1:69-1088(+)